ncbi:MAG: hypothetical protein NC453_22285 [Muribaculum sp.]|nr:hypothetical protein [Muribaculum sp.]
MKENMYKSVERHEEAIERLKERVETLETKSEAIIPESSAIELPEDIATLSGIRQLLEDTTEATIKSSLTKALQGGLSQDVKDALSKGLKKEFAEERESLRNIVSDLRYRVQSLINGQWWLAIPGGVWVLFVILLLGAGGFGYGFFYMLNQNTRLKDIEWLYRYERTLYDPGNSQDRMLQRETDFLQGTPPDKESFKNLIRKREHTQGLDPTNRAYTPPEE